jgi:photosystem II stability/assembly factor-like uncharacterized protein
MIATRRGFLRGLVALAAAAAIPPPATRVAASSAASVASRQSPVMTAPNTAQGGDWAALGPDVSVGRLFAPATGALFTATEGDLFRSDDAGTSWRQIELPLSQRKERVVEVDPADHRVIFADGDGGLQRTTDDGATWSTVLPSDRRTLRVAISPADPHVLYVAQQGASWTDWFFWRSLDQAASWENLEEIHNSMSCGWSIRLLYPHPTDPTRLFRTAGCYAGRDLNDTLDESRDRGSTFATIFTPRFAFPSRLVGGSGIEPGRYYLATNNDSRQGGSSLLVSADDAATWTPILEYAGGGTATGSTSPSITIGALSYDPTTPSRVFVSLHRHDDLRKPAANGGIVATSDAGASWSEIGSPEMPRVDDLALGIDGKYLFAASEQGVWRLALG